MAITTGQTALASDFINNASANTTPASDVGRVVKLESNGVLHGRFIDGGFGDGSDGDATLDGSTDYAGWSSRSGSTYTMTRDAYLSNLTVNSGVTLKTDGYRVFVRNVLDGAGTIDWGTANPGSNGGTGAGSDQPGAAGGAQSGNGQLKNIAGSQGASGRSAGGTQTNGGSGVTGSNQVACLGSNGVAGGAGGLGNSGDVSTAGGPGGTATAPVHKVGVFRALIALMVDLTAALAFARYTPAGGAGGGSGGSDSDTGFGSGAGGGGGASGGIIFIAARIWKGTFTIKSVGAAGGSGGPGGGGETGGGGGGGGGNGGCAVIVYARKLWTGVYNLAGGAGGSGGAAGGGPTSTAGGSGTSGASGFSYEIESAALA